MNRGRWTSYRSFTKHVQGSTKSEWYTLEKDQKYFIQGRFIEYGGGDHFGVGMEIEATEETPKGHHHSMKET